MQIYSDKVFDKPVEIIEAKECLKEALNRIEKLKEKYYLLGYITYDFDYLYFEAFDSFKKYTPDKPKDLGIVTSPLIRKEDYIKSIEKIKNYISEGVTYEVNYTYPIEVFASLDGLDLYEALIEKQKTPYNAFIKNYHTTLLSFSPELFFRIKDNKIFTKPMKGTAPRGKNQEEDIKQRDFLYHDTKNRAENIMIVDLLRNDLGRISKTGTVRVDKLFEIEAHPTVFQMTSEISAELQDNIGLYDVFKAIFPCGSITGAPKVSTMRVIDELEQYNRNIYCGAIGFLSPQECEFSVPIRILYGNNYKYTYHTGGAIVWDSDPKDELDETFTKTKFLETDFNLIETAVDDWDLHVKRMKNSALELGFKWNKEIDNIEIKGKTRVVLHKNGSFEVQYSDIPDSFKTKPLIKLQGNVNSNSIFLYHKTSIRPLKSTEIFEEVRVNERNEVTEGTFTNIAVKIGDKLYTPPLECGLLNGTYRQRLLSEGVLIEKIIYPEDLQKADKIFCFNSVRKMFEVELC